MKMMLLIVVAAALSQTIAAQKADVYDLLMPEPRQVVRSGAQAQASVLSRVSVVRGSVEGVPCDRADQAYCLDICPAGVRIVAGGEAGERFARTTLGQLVKLSNGRGVPCGRVTDWPLLRWRGFMYDCGRNYLAVEGVKAILDAAAQYKMNLFHWHLTDYHGWRLESKRYPQLKDPVTMSRQIGKFYSQREFLDVVAYARARGITVMPELDVPGHTLALRKGLGIRRMRDPVARKAVADLLEELCSLVGAGEMPFVHLGTDEARVEEEFVPADWCSAWARVVATHGHKVVRWAPGEEMSVSGGEVVDMVWRPGYETNSTHRAFDTAPFYYGSTDPFHILNQAAFNAPCCWQVPDDRKIGAVACVWHDDALGDDTLKLFREAMVFPGIVAFADAFWHGRSKWRDPKNGGIVPSVGTEAFALVESMERKMVAQRDRVLTDFKWPFPFVASTQMRWRLTDTSSGRVLAEDVATSTLNLADFANSSTNTVVAETWILSDRAREVGAWVSFTPFGCSYRRGEAGPMPQQGEWNGRVRATITLNGYEIPPPHWANPGLKKDGVYDPPGDKDPFVYKGAVCSDNVSETPLTDELVTLRPPIPVRIKEGWNHVRIVYPWVDGKVNWSFTFALIEGTSTRPHEVNGLIFRSCPNRR